MKCDLIGFVVEGFAGLGRPSLRAVAPVPVVLVTADRVADLPAT